MATYKKNNYRPNRGHSNKKEKEQDEKLAANLEKDSTTAEVFKTLDEGANKTENWVENNRKGILIGLAVILVLGFGYALYRQMVVLPREKEATEGLSVAMVPFQDALNAMDTKGREALFTEALNGKSGKKGLLAISKDYSSTKAGNTANYSIGMAYLQMNKYKEAIEYLDKFKTSEEPLKSLAYGNIGDAFMQLKQYKESLEYYKKAFDGKNSYTAPIYLKKASLASENMKDYAKALEYLERIKKEYPKSEEARNLDAEINRITTIKDNK